jgi:hypothetical protein
MATPIISRNTGLLGSLQWATYNLQLALLQGASITWTASSLPPGLSINSATGLISGTPTTPGIWHVQVKATNSDGADQVILYIPIRATTATAGSDIDLRINLFTRDVEPNVPGAVPSTAAAVPAGPPVICVSKEGDDLFFRVQLEKGGTIVDLDVTEFRVTLKELDTEQVICRGGGGTAEVDGVVYFKRYGSGSTTSYRVYMQLESAALKAVLADKEDEDGTFFNGRLEFDLEYNNADAATFGPETASLSSNTVLMRVTRPQEPA